MSQQFSRPQRPYLETAVHDRLAPERKSHDLRTRPSVIRQPWHSKGWVWLLFGMIALGSLMWVLVELGDAMRESAEATREHTNAIRLMLPNSR
jgi:hypothetical protein